MQAVLHEPGASTLIDAYMERRGDLLRFFTQRLGSPAAAEDLVQDIYIKASALQRERRIDNPSGYLFRLGSNLMLDRLRGERRSAARDADWRASHCVLVGREEAVDAPHPEDAIAARRRLETLVAALQELGPQTQRVFRLHKFEGLSHPEVACLLGISRSAVEKHVSAALKHLVKRLK